MSKKKLSNIGATILDSTLPFSDRRDILLQVCADPSEESTTTLASILDGAARQDVENHLERWRARHPDVAPAVKVPA